MATITSNELRYNFLKEFVNAIILYKVQKETQLKTNLSQTLIRAQPQVPIPIEPIIPLIRRYKEKILGVNMIKREGIERENNKKIQEPLQNGDQFFESIKVEQAPQTATPILYEKKQSSLSLRAPPGILRARTLPQKIQSGRTLQRPTMPILVGSEFSQIASERLKYLLFLMTDNTIASIECPGPNKQLILNKLGAIKPAGVSLTAEEINEIMKEISERTKIPLNQGLFKTAFNNIIITAVVSEFVGTRFVIERSNQIQNPQPLQGGYR